MAKRKKSRSQRRLPSPEAVLAGSVEVDIEGLMSLVQQVNPTERGLAPQETERRYAQKGRLQSLLIRRFADRLTVEPLAGDANTVGIRLRASEPRSGTHARLDALDDDARAWVRFELDQGMSPGDDDAEPWSWNLEPDVARTDRTDNASSLLRRGQAALDSYDYDEAQRCFEAALGQSGTKPEPARALLELLVDHLAADEQALQVGQTLPAAIAADAGARTLLGLAAARAGRAEQSRSWIRGLTGPRVVEVWAMLARAAVEVGDLAAAAEAYEQGRLLAPAAPELTVVNELIAQARRRRRRPLEEALTQTFASGRLDEAEVEARALLREWPGSAVAPRILSEITQARRAAISRAHLASGLEALAQHEFDRALHHLEAAGAHGASAEALEQPLAAARAGAEQARRGALVESVLAALNTGDRRAGLVEWLALEPELRAQVASKHPLTAFESLEQAGAPTSGGVAKSAVDAVLALDEAEQALERREPHLVLVALRPHERWLASVERARIATVTARSQIDEIERAAARDGLARATRLAQDGDLHTALDQVNRIDVARLDQAEQSQLTTLRSAVGAEIERGLLQSRLPDLEARGAFLEARAVIDQLAAQTGGAERQRWQTRRSHIIARLRHAWSMRPFEFEPHSDDRRDVTRPLADEHATVSLTADGQEALVVEWEGYRALFRQIDVATSRTIRAFAIELPVESTWMRQVMGEDYLWLWSTDNATAILIDPDTFEPQRVIDLSHHLRPDWHYEHIEPVPGTSLVWMLMAISGGLPSDIQIVDIETRRVVRTLTDATQLSVVPGEGEPRVVRMRETGGVSVHNAVGHLLPWDTDKAHLHIMNVAPAGDGRGLILVTSYPLPNSFDDWVDGDPIALIYLAPDGTMAKPWVIPDSTNTFSNTVAGSSEAGCVFAYYATADQTSGPSHMSAITLGLDGAREHWRRRIRGDVELLTDCRGRRAVVAVHNSAGHHMVRLSRQAPKFSTAPGSRHLPGISLLADCPAADTSSDESRDAKLKAAELRDASPALREQTVAACLIDRETCPADVIVLADALKITMQGELSNQLVRGAVRRFPDDWRLQLRHIRTDLRPKGQWHEIAERLNPIYDQIASEDRRLQVIPVAARVHAFHVLGLARAHGGDMAGAAEAWRQGQGIGVGHACHLDRLVKLAEQDIELQASDGELEDGHVATRTRDELDEVRILALRRRALAADARGEPHTIVGLLDRAPVWRRGDLPTFACLVDAWLDQPEANPVRQFRQLHAAARLLVLAKPEGRLALRPPRLPFPNARWTHENLAGLVAHTKCWLDAQRPAVLDPPPADAAVSVEQQASKS